MSEAIIVDSAPTTATTSSQVPDRISRLIAKWLHAKGQNSQRTEQEYRAWLTSFREHWRTNFAFYWRDAENERRFGSVPAFSDLDAPPKLIAAAAQAWASLPNSRNGRPVAASTQNLRLAAVAGFYQYAINNEDLSGPNPIDRVQRTKRSRKSSVRPLALEGGEIEQALAAIPSETPNGVRDRAMLALTLYTGRRLSEMSNLRYGDVKKNGNGLTLEWQKTKGGEPAINHLAATCPAVQYLNRWMQHWFGDEHKDMDAFVFVSLARNSIGHRLTPQGIGQRCERWLGTSRFHRLRHTFALAYLKASDGDVLGLQNALGHKSLAVTSVYAHDLTEGENPHIDAMRDVYAGKHQRKR